MSLHVIVRRLDEALRAKGCPFRARFGRERFRPTVSEPGRVVVEYAGPAADSPVAVTSQHAQHRVGQIAVGCKLTVYARSPLPGAREQDHTDLTERIRDLVWGELRTVVQALPSQPPTWVTGGFVEFEDAAGSDVFAGAVYELTFSIPHGVATLETTWAELMADHAANVAKPGALEEVEIVAASETGPLHFPVTGTTLSVS